MTRFLYQPADVLATRAAAQAQVQQTVTSSPNPKQPYGGLVPAQPKGTRAYTDAASYNQHLNQHQSYTAQAAQQASQQPIRNPYAQPQQQQQQQQQALPPQVYENRNDYSSPNIGELPQHAPRLQHQLSSSALGASSSYSQQPAPPTQQYTSPGLSNATAPSNSYYPNQRGRANTINQPDQAIPPALARIANMGMDVSGIKRNTLTPVLNREEAIREWERRASGQRQPPAPAYPQLEYLQQQAELAASNWNGVGSSSGSGSTTGLGLTTGNSSRRYQPSTLSHFQSPPSAVTIDSSSNKHHRDQSMSMAGMRDISMGSLSRPNTGPGTSYDQSATHHLSANLPPAPPQAYAGTSSTRYGTTNALLQQQQTASSSNSASYHTPSSPYDAFDGRDGLGTLYTPMQPTSVNNNNQQSPYSPGGNGNGNGVNPNSFYGGGVISSSSSATQQQQQQQQQRGRTQQQQSQQW